MISPSFNSSLWKPLFIGLASRFERVGRLETANISFDDQLLMEEAATDAGLGNDHTSKALHRLSNRAFVIKSCFFKHLALQSDGLLNEQLIAAMITLVRFNVCISTFETPAWTACKIDEAFILDETKIKTIFQCAMSGLSTALRRLKLQLCVSPQLLSALLHLGSSALPLLDSNKAVQADFFEDIAPMIDVLHYLRRCDRYGRELPDPLCPSERYAEAFSQAIAEDHEVDMQEPPAVFNLYHRLLLAATHLCTPNKMLVKGISHLKSNMLPHHLRSAMISTVAAVFDGVDITLHSFALCCHPETVKASSQVVEFMAELKSPEGIEMRRQLLQDGLVIGALAKRISSSNALDTTPNLDMSAMLWSWLQDVLSFRGSHPDEFEQKICVQSAISGLTALAMRNSRLRLRQMQLFSIGQDRPLRVILSQQLHFPKLSSGFLSTKRGKQLIQANCSLGADQDSLLNILGHAQNIPVRQNPVCLNFDPFFSSSTFRHYAVLQSFRTSIKTLTVYRWSK